MGTTVKSVVLPVAVAVLALGLTVLTQVAGATHPRTKGASPIRAPLLPAYESCTMPDRTHGPPLAFPSCNPPGQASSFVTVGTPDANPPTPANSTGFVKYQVNAGNPGLPDDQDVGFTLTITDVRTQGSPYNDYAGELQATSTVRITDHNNSPTPGGGNHPATVIDIEYPVTLPCVTTSSNSIGSTCSIFTTFDAILDGSASEGHREVWELGQVRVYDGGADGLVSTTPNTLFAAQGVFIP